MFWSLGKWMVCEDGEMTQCTLGTILSCSPFDIATSLVIFLLGVMLAVMIKDLFKCR